MIPQSVFDTYYETVDELTNVDFGVTCTLLYPLKKTDCQNCIFDPFLGTSSNKYQSGGPIPFTNGLCPYCNGEGYTAVIPTEDIKMRVYYDKKSWVKMPVPITVPDGSVQSIGHMTDLPKILMCTEMRLHKTIEGQGTFTYILAGEPVPHGFKKNKYFIAIWARK